MVRHRRTLVAALAVATVAGLAAGVTTTAAMANPIPAGAAGHVRPMLPPTSIDPPTITVPTITTGTTITPPPPQLTATMTRTVSDPSGIAFPGSTVTFDALIENTGTVRVQDVWMGGWPSDLGAGAANAVPCVSYVRNGVRVTPPWSTGTPPAAQPMTDAWGDDLVDLFFPSVSLHVNLGVGASSSAKGYLDPGQRQRVTVTLKMADTACTSAQEIGLHSFVDYTDQDGGGWFDASFVPPWRVAPVAFGGALAVPVGHDAIVTEAVRYPSTQGDESSVSIHVAGPASFVKSASASVSPAAPGVSFKITPPTVGRYEITGAFDGDAVNLPATATSATLIAYFHDYAPGATFFDDVLWLAQRRVTLGDGVDFRPVDVVSRQAMAAFLYRMDHDGQDAGPCATAPFPDVLASNPFCGAIAWLAERQITQGGSDGFFHPTAAVSRQSMAAFLYRYANPSGLVPQCTTAPFTDVAAGSVFCPEIGWLVSQGVTQGYADGTFAPAAPVSRQAMAAFLHRLSG